MSLQDAPERAFAQPTRQLILMLLVLAAVAVGGFLLAAQIQTVFLANVYLNAFIGFVFVLGVFATFWQVWQISNSVRWLRNLQAGFKGHEFTQPPTMIASMAPMIREGRIKKRLATSATRSILDSIAIRLDESREITRYIVGLLIFLGLLGTFWGLSQTVPAVVDTIRSLADTEDGNVLGRLISGLEDAKNLGWRRCDRDAVLGLLELLHAVPQLARRHVVDQPLATLQDRAIQVDQLFDSLWDALGRAR